MCVVSSPVTGPDVLLHRVYPKIATGPDSSNVILSLSKKLTGTSMEFRAKSEKLLAYIYGLAIVWVRYALVPSASLGMT